MKEIAKKVLSGSITVAELLEHEPELLEQNLANERFNKADSRITKGLLNICRVVEEQCLKTHAKKPLASLKNYDNLASWFKYLEAELNQ